MKYKILAAMMAAASVNAQALSGKVVDEHGQAIVDARIEIVGSQTSIATGNQGQFSFTGEPRELHVTAPGYSHKLIHIDELDTTDTLTITLNRSVIHQVDVIGIPLHASVIESAQPIAVLSGEELRNRQAATLGDSLEGMVGVHSNFHGNVASTPIIRGLSGPRVLIAQNGLDVSDVSRVGPDHSVASEVSTAQQVEVLRGPATLFFGSGAIGGVVNVVDTRVPTDNKTTGEWLLSHETVNNQKLASANLNTGSGNIAFHADGFWREADDYEVPVPPEQQGGHGHSSDFMVPNSADQSSGVTLGSSYLLDNGYVGVSVGRLDRQYGIPGHSHGEDQHEGEAASVYAELEQDRIQLISELDVNLPYLRAINTRAGITEYTHAEIEAGEVGTVFSNKTAELRLDALHQPVADWRGAVVLHYKNSDVSAQGTEAFTPPSATETFAVAITEERHLGEVLLQLGARAERVTVSADDVLLPAPDIHSHEGEGAHHPEHDAPPRVFRSKQEFVPISLSVGAVWDFASGYNLGVSVSHSQRAPSAAELLSFGPHIGTRSYEIGALFALHEDEGEAHFDLNEAALELEAANNIDLTLRKHEGNVGIILNAFYNQVDNYYYQKSTVLFVEAGHDHDHGGSGTEDAHAGELPVFTYTSADAVLHGLEAQGLWQLTPSFKSTVFADYVRAKLKDDSNLPRTPPLRFGTQLDYQWQQLSANLTWTHYQDQNKVADLETTTEGYHWLDATVTYHLPVASNELAVFIKAENLSDTEARVHTSFLKDIAPKPGRNFSIGLRGTF